MEKIMKPMSGFIVLILSLAGIVFGIYLMTLDFQEKELPPIQFWIGLGVLLISGFFIKGLTVINPNHSVVCVF